MDEWISKKDLLTETGISYGQLYRWKRERLIPDSWFVKRSTFTGQETFLPRERTLERIRFILENKDQYSLSELLDQLTPHAKSRTYAIDRLASIPGAMRPIVRMSEVVGARTFDHGQALCVLICAQILLRHELPDDALTGTLAALNAWQEKQNLLQNADGKFALIKTGETYLPLYLHPDSQIDVPESAEVVFELSLGDLPERYNPQLNELFKGDEE